MSGSLSFVRSSFNYPCHLNVNKWCKCVFVFPENISGCNGLILIIVLSHSAVPLFLAATKQLYKWYFPSVCLSVCLSVCHTFFTMFPSSYHHEIFRSYYHGQKWCPCKSQGQRSKVKVTEVNTQLSRFRILTPVWIHIWQWNHAHSWKQHRRGALLFFKVIRQISRSHGSKNRRIWPRLGVSGL